jgi:hypothetical protein
MVTNDTPTKKQLIRNIESANDRYTEAINSLNPEDFYNSAHPGEWTGKDIVAHVSSWEKLLWEWLEAARTGIAPNTPVICDEANTERMNAQIYRKNQDRNLDEILSEVQPTFEKTFTLVREYASDENLGGRLPYDWACDDSLWKIIAYNTYLHFDEHAETLHEIAIADKDKGS